MWSTGQSWARQPSKDTGQIGRIRDSARANAKAETRRSCGLSCL